MTVIILNPDCCTVLDLEVAFAKSADALGDDGDKRADFLCVPHVPGWEEILLVEEFDGLIEGRERNLFFR